MTVGKVLVTGLKILAVCLVFALCFVAGGILSGLNKIGQQAPPTKQAISSLSEAPPKPQPQQMPEDLVLSFLIFSACAGVALSYLILRSSSYGLGLVGAISVSTYGVSTVAAQIESVFFLSEKLPRGMIQAIFLQGAIATILFAPLAVLLLASGVLLPAYRRLYLRACALHPLRGGSRF